MNNSRIQEIQQKASQLLIDANIPQRPPVDVHTLANHLKIEIIEHTFEDGISGVLHIDKTRNKIGINQNEAPVRKRFTVAHEIGHFYLGHTRPDSLFIDQPKKHMSVKLYRDGRSSTGDYWQEREANAFAASILMPDFMVDEEILNTELDLSDEDSLKNLANKFEVSTQAMAFRLSNLGYLNY